MLFNISMVKRLTKRINLKSKPMKGELVTGGGELEFQQRDDSVLESTHRSAFLVLSRGQWRRLLFFIQYTIISILIIHTATNSQETQGSIGKLSIVPLKERPNPTLMEGFYVNADGDSVYRMLTSGDWTLDRCRRELEILLKASHPDPYCESPLPAIAYVANKFACDNLLKKIINFPETNPEYIRDKTIAFLQYDFSYKSLIEDFVTKGLSNSDPQTRFYAALIFARWGEWEKASQVLRESENFYSHPRFLELKNSEELIRGVIHDMQNSAYSRMQSAWAIRTLKNDTSILNSTSLDILANIDSSTTDMDEKRGYWLAARWIATSDDSQAVDGLLKLAFMNDVFIADQAVQTLGILAAKEVVEAENALYMIREKHPNKMICKEASRLIP